MPSNRPERHGWVWLARRWADQLRTPIQRDAAAMIEAWRAAGRPFVVAAAAASDTGDDVRLGLATPNKRRIGLHVGAVGVARMAPPLRLRDALANAPTEWRERLARVDAEARGVGLTASVFGSLAWQHQSDVVFLRPASDIDLLFDARLTPALAPVLAFTAALANDAQQPRLDGEIMLPSGGAAAWREFARRPNLILVKGEAGPSLRARRSVEAQFPSAATAMQIEGAARVAALG